jgi:hypothetical protein
MREAEHVERMGEKCIQVTVGKIEREKLLRRSVYMKIILKCILEKYVGLLRVRVAQDTEQQWILMNTLMDLKFLLNAGNFMSDLQIVGFTRTLYYGVG